MRVLRFPLLVSGGMAEWSCSGLQSRGRRFDSDSRLHEPSPGGETGRHKGLKIPRPQGHAGSTPAPGTTAKRTSKMTAKFFAAMLAALAALVSISASAADVAGVFGKGRTGFVVSGGTGYAFDQ